MINEFFNLLSDWYSLDTWIVVTAALAAMSCALPGAWLLLRRQSLLGDALSHSILPGIVLAYLAMHWFEEQGWLSATSSVRHLVLFLGAAVSGVVSAITTEVIQRWGRLDRSAAMGVVFTTMFAVGLLLIRMFADSAHVDPGCVLYGSLETSALIPISRTIPIPRAVVMNGIMLAINGGLVILFFKELRLSTFDPGLAVSMGLRADWIQLVLMSMTAATLVAAFESVGAILVIAMLIVPSATARLLTDRLSTMLVLSLVIAALSAVLGHVGALTLPSIVFSRLGYPDVYDASTSGMMAVAAGGLFVLAILASPRHGVIRRFVDRVRLQLRIASEDILGTLFRRDERTHGEISPSPISDPTVAIAGIPPREMNGGHAVTQDPIPLVTVAHGTWIEWFARRNLQRKGFITADASVNHLTDKGRDLAQSLVRSHRLWEAYMARHFELPGDHFHATAEQVEHFLCPQLQTDLATELDQPSVDPHGKAIPNSTSSDQ
ncbi:metal ABC transporter permease [Schlesneria sp. T3-172]|uniref:metal ABC transporter permease n=1 Tax=Schlesneria sphaerica TaxID=3373610 RepID=UPI0037CBAB53